MRNPLTVISEKIVHGLENFFCWYGEKVAKHPFIVIIGCLILTGVAAVGVINYRVENNAFKLWIPDNSDFVENNEWLEKNAPSEIRFNSMIVTSPGGNILSPSVLQHLSTVRKKVNELKTPENGLDWKQQCFERQIPPVLSPFMKDDIPYPAVCGWIQNMETACFEQNILEFWPQNFDFSTLTDVAQVVETVNRPNATSSLFKTSININDYLGGQVTRDGAGNVVAAEATFMRWFGKINISSITPADISSMGTGEIVDANSMEWEKSLEEALLEDQKNLPEGVETFVNVARGYSDVAGETIVNDAMMMPIGFMIVFVYVVIMLGKFSCTEQRALLALGGLACIGLTVGFTYGFCSAVDLFYGPMHNIIPFLLLGIGIDDMFVIIQCYDNLGQEKTDSVITNMGLTLRHAGVAITVTSFTDFIVFALGATTVLPALRSFCLWCSVGIIVVYFFQATLFTAFLSLDCRRLTSNRNGLCPCYTHKNVKQNIDINKIEYSFAQKGFQIFSRIIFSIPGMVVVILMGAGLLGGGIYGLTELEQKFDPVWFLPQSSGLSKWFSANEEYFPSTGEEVTVYLTDLDWETDLDKVGSLVEELKKATDIIEEVNDWYGDLILSKNTAPCNGFNQSINSLLTCFLFSSFKGFASQGDFKFVDNANLTCGSPSPQILLGKFTFTHKRFSGRSEHIPALNKVKDIINSIQFSTGDVFPMAREYSNWETDEVITTELFRNLGLALACVFVVTLILLADLLGSVYVLLCVLLTLIDLCGYMHFWDITIDVVSSVNIIIAIGLCVDYSAHICHTFLTIHGDRKERAIGTLVNIGPAVLNGGISTFIAFILLAGSDSHVFSSFFKIFFLVVLFGLFHGLVLLPVLLRIAGPRSYSSAAPPQLDEKRRAHQENNIKL